MQEINQAHESLCKGSINNASYQFQKIIYRETENQDELEMHHHIFMEAEKFAQECLDQISEESFPEILK